MAKMIVMVHVSSFQPFHTTPFFINSYYNFPCLKVAIYICTLKRLAYYDLIKVYFSRLD